MLILGIFLISNWGRFVRLKEQDVLEWLESNKRKGRKSKAIEIEF